MGDLFPNVKQLLRLGLDAAEARLPFRLKIGMREDETEDEPLPLFFAALLNTSRDKPLLVREVRIHYGNNHSRHAFVLQPDDEIELAPAGGQEFHLSFRKHVAEIQRMMLQKTRPEFLKKDYPTVGSGVELFMSIIFGREEDSWIEIDFNKSFGRQFRRGLVKREFLRVGAGIARLPRIQPE
jgi:hypothetical protein